MDHHLVVVTKENLVAVDTVAIVVVENQANVVVDHLLVQEQVTVQRKNVAAATAVVASQPLTDAKAAETVTLLFVTKTKQIKTRKTILLIEDGFFIS